MRIASEGPFAHVFRGDVDLIGTVFSGLRLDGVLHTKARKDGKNATDRIILETFLALCQDNWEEQSVSPHAEREFRRYLEWGILAHGLRPCTLRKLRPRLPRTVLLQGARDLSVLQHPPNGGDRRAPADNVFPLVPVR